ncbi:hypothetical protein Ddc_14712 [Ditylenchus destructor]|nr:hypothetical protein Ddc_14712 [Ditylenchus destructor]
MSDNISVTAMTPAMTTAAAASAPSWMPYVIIAGVCAAILLIVATAIAYCLGCERCLTVTIRVIELL